MNAAAKQPGADPKTLLRRGNVLKSLRQPMEQVVSDCFAYTIPLRGSGFNGGDLTVQQGAAKRADLLDGTGAYCVNLLASSIMAGETPSNSLWFGMTTGDDNETDEEKRWFEEESKALWMDIHGSNFDSAGFEAILDAVIAGWCALFIDEDRENGGLVFESWAIANCYFASTRTDGRIDTAYKCFKLSAEQAVREYGDKVSEDTQKLAVDKPDEMVEFWHCIYPRKPYAVGARLAKNLPFASCHIEAKKEKLVRESGFHEFPLAVPRWMRAPNSVYAVGQVYNVLPDLKELNDAKFLSKAANELQISGMWIAEDDGVLNPRTVKVGPRKIIVANSVDSMKPLMTGADFNVAFISEDKLQAAIRRGMMADQLQPVDGPQMTATEVHVRVDLIRQQLGPLYGRFQNEWVKVIVERCFSLKMRAGAVSPAPQSLADREFTVKFIGPMARAQKLEEVTATERYSANMANLAAIDPNVMDNFDTDAAARGMSESLGVPQKYIRDSKKVAAIRDQREKAKQKAEQQAAAQQVAQVGGEEMAKQMAAGGQK